MACVRTLAYFACLVLAVTSTSQASPWQRPASPTAAFLQMLQDVAFNFMTMNEEVDELPVPMRDVIYDALSAGQDQEPMSVVSCSVCMVSYV